MHLDDEHFHFQWESSMVGLAFIYCLARHEKDMAFQQKRRAKIRYSKELNYKMVHISDSLFKFYSHFIIISIGSDFFGIRYSFATKELTHSSNYHINLFVPSKYGNKILLHLCGLMHQRHHST